MDTIIADTGFVVALTNRSDAKHEVVKAIYLQQQKFLLSLLVPTLRNF
jgi:predicted nucleic acid-binding protein